MQTTVAVGYIPPTNSQIDDEVKKVGLKFDATEFIKDVCNIQADGRFLTTMEMDKEVRAEMHRAPIRSTGSLKGKDLRFHFPGTANSFNTHDECSEYYEKYLHGMSRQVREAVEFLPELEQHTGTPMEQAVNMLQLLSSQENVQRAQENGKNTNNDLLQKMFSKHNLQQAKEAMQTAKNLSKTDKSLLDKLNKLKKKEPSKDGSNPNGGTYGTGMADNSATGKTDEGLSLIDTAILVSNKQMSDVLKISRHMKCFAKMRSNKSTKFSPDVEGDDVQARRMSSVSDIGRVQQEALALRQAAPNLFNYRLVTNQFNVRQRGIQLARKQLLYMSVDCSGSMRDEGSRRINIAGGVLMNRLVAVIDGDAEVYWRFFDTCSHACTYVKNEEEAYASIRNVLQHGAYTGGGTNFHVAITDAVNHIVQIRAENNLHKPELLMVTDGDCSCSLTLGDLQGIKLHTVLVANDGCTRDIERLARQSGGMFLDMSNVID